MQKPGDFIKYYKSASNTELLAVMENPGDYQPSAVEAVKNELKNRQVSETEIGEVKQQILQSRLKQEKQKEKIKAVEGEVKKRWDSFIETLNPIQSETPTAEKLARFITIVFGIVFVRSLFQDYALWNKLLKYYDFFDPAVIICLFPLVILLPALITFWKRKSVGWILLSAFVTFSIIIAVVEIILTFTSKSPYYAGFGYARRPSSTAYIVQLLFFSGTAYALCRQDLRKLFNIDQQKMITAIVISGLCTIFLLLLVYHKYGLF